ncbi:PREDICTED: heat shock 70 kDa protein 12A-like [Amphimedon queenslandica]|uniref:Uncharacterized protein n=1 Tax=Amphimedon queenslandica TaxID=400682 RepID=A0A1X7UV99_AMPQE|nr:PREDICTED: heat shock 70 kDa protein 12A-like [Amphimedon queenslandica]|eukprot:XP_011404042.1 PREDICTED: heat shock 70 kDa protein 12A-like [Amphimedon queenslandica]
MGNTYSRPQRKIRRGTPLQIPANIAAIDFGTTALSLSYSTKGDVDGMPKTLPFGPDKISRIPNAILLQRGDLEDNKINIVKVVLGDVARDKFFKLKVHERKDYIYFERIKMLLRREKGINREVHVTSFTGEPFYLLEVIAFILKYLSEELQEHLSRTVLPLKKNNFDWVITVPAIWDAQSKRMMREAAFLSGMLTEKEGLTALTPVATGVQKPEEVNPEKLSLALEPECAAIYSQAASKKEAEQYKNAATSKDEVEEVVAKLGKGYMIIDAGGGTVDITAQVEVKGGGVEVVTVPIGNALGGTQINEKFSSIFQASIYDKGFSSFYSQSDKAGAAIDKLVYTEFESQKISLGKGTHNEMVVGISKPIMTFYGEEKLEGGNFPIGFEFEDDNIRITEDAAEKNLFDESIKSLIEHMFEALKSPKMDHIETIYLVGGFGSSKLVEKHVKEALQRKSLKIQVIVPTSPTLAIATGAVMLRKNPAFIKARCADANYGIAITEKFDSKKHDPAYKIKGDSNDEYYCKDVFDVFLQKGELVSYGEEFVTQLCAPDGSEEVTLEIYSTEENGIKYVKAPDGKPKAKSVGKLIIEAPNPDKLSWKERQIDVMMNFSGSEIQARAMYRSTNKEVKTVIDYL